MTDRPASIRYYLDADVLGLAKVLVRLRSDLTYPGDPGGAVHRRARPPCPITTPATPDGAWIPEVARHGWLIITRDSSIQDNRREINAVRDHGARMVALSGREAGDTFAQLEVVMCQWRRIEALTVEPGPFVYAATRTSLRAVDLT